jgi:hypothetical protein
MAVVIVSVTVPMRVAVVVTGRGSAIVVALMHFMTILPVRTTPRSPAASLVGSLTLRGSDFIDAFALDCEHLNEASLLPLSVLE